MAIINGLGITVTGIVAADGLGGFFGRTLTGTANQVSVANGTGVSANPTLSLPNTVIAPGSLTSTTLFSALAGQVVNRTDTAVSYNVLTTDYIVAVTDNSSARTITLPAAPTTNQVFIVKDAAGTAASSHNITVTVSGGAINIDNATTFAITENYQSATFYFNGTQYYTI